MGLIISPLGFNVPEQTYSGTITWSGTTAPSGGTTHTYEWFYLLGNLVFLRVFLLYATAGSALTNVLLTLPTDCPTPVIPSGRNAASSVVAVGSGWASTGTPGVSAASVTARVDLRTNAGNNGFEINLGLGSINAKTCQLLVEYWTS